MRLGPFLILFLLTCSTSSSAQWQWLNPEPSGATNYKIAFPTPQKGFILNSSGDLLVTEDQGSNWRFSRQFPESIAMDFKDSVGVVASLFNTIYITTDAGDSWQALATDLTDNIEMVQTISKDTIFLANKKGYIFRTDDGGKSWHSFYCGGAISSIDFVNANLGFVGGREAFIAKTIDGGATWKEVVKVNYSPSNIPCIRFFNEKIGFAFRGHSTLLKTTDGGDTWTEQQMNDNIFDVFFVSASVCFLAGEHGARYRTTNGGRSWTWIGDDARYDDHDINSTYFFNAELGFAVGMRGRILKTTNGGKTWQPYSPTYNDFKQISFGSATTGYALTGGALYKTTDAGENWQQLPVKLGTTSSGASFINCHFFDEDTGIITWSHQAAVLRTTDGGKTWKNTNPGGQNGYDLIGDLKFINKKTGFISLTGGSSGLFKTKDGGSTWSQIGNYQNFQNLYFLNEQYGFASFWDKLYRTTDSAKTWTELLEADYDINSIHFINDSIGFFTSHNATLQTTRDSGRTWIQVQNISADYNNDFDHIEFYNSKIGYLTSEYGYIYKTIDGGNQWNVALNGPREIRDVAFSRDGNVYAAGVFGAIRKGKIAESHVEALQAWDVSSCSAELRTSITAVGDVADSIRFEYGIQASDSILAATPYSVADTQHTLKAYLSKLMPATTYQVRLSYYFDGKLIKSEISLFRTEAEVERPTITASDNTVSCGDKYVTIRSSAPAGNQWYFNGQLLADSIGQSITVNKSGAYHFVTSSKCSIQASDSIIIKIRAVPDKPTITVTGVVLQSSVPDGNQWLLNNVPILGATAQQYTALTSGAYTVQVDKDQCVGPISEKAEVAINIDGAFLGGDVSIYPNPIIDKLFITNLKRHKLSVGILDTQGSTIMTSSFSETMGNINLSSLKTGMYVLSITNQQSNEVDSKLIFKR